MTRTKEEAREYQRGYAAGKKRTSYELDRALAAAEREDFRQRAALVALQQMLLPGNGWGVKKKGGEHVPYTTMPEYSRAAFNLADQMVQLTHFSGLRKASSIAQATEEDHSNAS